MKIRSAAHSAVKILKTPSFQKWLFVGTTTMAIDAACFGILALIMSLPIWFANALSTSVSVLYNYSFHHYWTFGNHNVAAVSTFPKYLAQYAATYTLGTLIIYVVAPLTGEEFGKIISLAVVAPIGYILMRFWVFKSSKIG